MTDVRNTRVTILLNESERDEVDEWEKPIPRKIGRSECFRLFARMVIDAGLVPTEQQLDSVKKRPPSRDT